LGLTQKEFFELCWVDYERLCYKTILDSQYQWQHTRELASWIYNMNRGANSSYKTGREIIPLPIDGLAYEAKKPLTVEEHKTAVKALSKFFKN